MAEELIPTNLGFAEFIGKLIGETFEAVATAQAEQAQKYAQLLAEVALSANDFADRYVSESQAVEWLEDRLGRTFDPSITLSMDVIAKLTELLDAEPDEWLADGADAPESSGSRSKILHLASIAIAKEALATRSVVLASNSLPRLAVDTGEIRAKITFAVSQTTNAGDSDESTDKNKQAGPARGGGGSEPGLLGGAAGEIVRAKVNVKRQVFTDPKTKEQTILVSPAEVGQRFDRDPLPDVRLTVKPAGMVSSSSAEVFSEVTIRFKSI